MAFNTIKTASLIIVMLGWIGCNSPMYQIVEVEEPVEVKKQEPPELSSADKKESEEYKSAITDILNAPPQTKFAEKDVVSRTYIIQIGAFDKERNADSFLSGSQKKLPNEQIYTKEVDGQYKVRFGSFKAKEDAVNRLKSLWGEGFTGAFVLEVTSVKTLN
jgi:cell division protein FtsN